MLIGSHEEASSAAGRIADYVPDFRSRAFNHHSNNMPWRPELTILSCSFQFRKKIFIEIAFGIHVLFLYMHAIDDLYSFNEQRCGRDCEDCVLHVFGIEGIFST